MTIMWLNLSLVYLFSFLSRLYSVPMPNTLNRVMPNKLHVTLVVLCLVTVAGLQKNIGDTYFYMHSFKITEFTWQDIDFSGDFGFNIYQLLLQELSSDPQILIFTTALITNLLIIIVLYKYSRMFEIAVYVYIAAGMFTTSMNGIRQYLAAAIVFLSTKYLLNGDFKKYALIILLASTVHKSALVLLPIYFVVRREAWTKVTLILLTLSIFIVLGFNVFSDMLFSALDNTQYGQYSDFAEGGANKLRVVVIAIPVLIAFLGREKLKKLWPESDYIVNMSIISVFFIIIASQNWIFARFNIYFGLYSLILISWIVKLFREHNQRLIYFGIIVFYFIYFYFEHVISFGLRYESDYLKF
jgi:transmembrane protein EpsG